ncbi:hypothetical protein [Halorubrum halophilum]|uniref:hypothetical protein n=1 Tax=Halorubrum halophilum TaxID=413816 RepID=UPI00186B46DE|nr:hypothetical protein [Halorubrum halophilum]
MSDRPADGDRGAGSASDSVEATVDADSRPSDADSRLPDADPPPEIDDEVQRRLRAAYLNDAERELIVTGVRSADEAVVVTFRTPHGDTTHTERFPAPRHGSLTESASFMSFLSTAGVSPLELDDLVGARVPATYEDGAWRLADSYLPDAAGRSDRGEAPDATERSVWARSKTWLWTYRYWLFAALFVGGELLFVAVIILLYA